MHVTESVLLQSTERSPYHIELDTSTAQDSLDDLGDSPMGWQIQAFQPHPSSILEVIEINDLQVDLSSVLSFPKGLKRVFNISLKSIAIRIEFLSLT